MKNILLLASQSKSRSKLLQESQIPHRLVNQTADELKIDRNLPFEQLVQSIAVSKMEHAQLPSGTHNQIIFVLSADTLGKNQSGIVHGKPQNKQEALDMLKTIRQGTVCTAFCLEKKTWQDRSWRTVQKIHCAVSAELEFCIPDEYIEQYLKQIPYLDVSGAIHIEGYGAQFTKIINGSYSTILGLPLFEVRESLEQIGFF